MKKSCALAVACGLASTGFAEDILVSFPVAPGAEAIAVLSDLDDDGVRDVAIHESKSGVVIRSGRFGHVLRTIPLANATSIVDVASAGDLDGDGSDDVVVGDPTSLSAAATVFSAADGTPLLSIPRPDGLGAVDFGRRAQGVGDVDGDGASDLVVTSPLEAGGAGRARVFSGRTGVLIHLVVPQASGAGFGQDVAVLGDLSGDSIPDFAVSSLREVKVVNGATGATIRTHLGALADQFGFSICGVGDADFDGISDLAVGAPLSSASSFGRVTVYSGANGATISDTAGGLGAGARFGFDLAPMEPLANGIARVLVGAPGGTNGLGTTLGSAVIWEIGQNQGLAAVGSSPGDGLGRLVASVGDINDDGTVDAIVTRFENDEATAQRRVEFMSPESLGLVSDGPSVSLGEGGEQILAIDGMEIVPSVYQPVEEVAAGRPYVVLGSASGTSPGFSLGVNHHVPLNFDGYFALIAATLGANHVIGGVGVLDDQGEASVTVVVPPLEIPSLVGLVLHHAVVVFEGPGLGGVVRGVSNAAPLRLSQ